MDARTLRLLALAFLWGGPLTASRADAATVGLNLVVDPDVPGCLDCTLSGSGTWNLFASASHFDNAGIAAYNIPIINVSSVNHVSPYGGVLDDGSLSIVAPGGFSGSRSANDVPTLFAFQNLQEADAFRFYGLGQMASSLADQYPGLSALGPNHSQLDGWDAPLILAEGTYETGQHPSINFYNTIELGVLVFKETSTLATEGAFITDRTIIHSSLLNAEFTVRAGESVMHVFDAPYVPDLSDPAWAVTYFDGPDGAMEPSIVPDFSNWQLTAEFQWDSTGTPLGTYHASIVFNDPFMGPARYEGIVTIHVVPEPVGAALFGLGAVGMIGVFRHNRRVGTAHQV